MIFNYKNTPLVLCNNVKLQNINASNSSKFLKSLHVSKSSLKFKSCDLQCSDVDFNLSSYYSVNDFQNTNLEVN